MERNKGTKKNNQIEYIFVYAIFNLLYYLMIIYRSSELSSSLPVYQYFIDKKQATASNQLPKYKMPIVLIEF